MFRGISEINLDAKGRITIPTRYRTELEESCERQMIVTVGLNEKCAGEEGCLWLYPIPEWERVERDILKQPTLNKMASKLKRFFIGNASECEMDKQGRLLLSDKLRKYAGLEKHVVLVGQLNKFEIWNDEAWRAKEDEWRNDDDSEGLEQLSTLSF